MAAFVPTGRLDLGAVTPDFVSVSFYKMFGYPTGVGCLLVRNDALPCLHRPWFAGGTVNFATVQGRHHVLAPREAGFEDGTLDQCLAENITPLARAGTMAMTPTAMGSSLTENCWYFQ